MRSRLLSLLILVVPLGFVRAVEPTPVRKIQKVAIANLAWDAARAAEVEGGTKHELVQKGVFAESLRTLTSGEKKPANVKELAALLKSQGYESLLCVGARKTMRITTADKANDFPTMDTCLSIFLTGQYPSGTSLRSEPFVVEAQPTLSPSAGSDYTASRSPMTTNPGAAPVTYFKRTLRLFDVSSQKLVWEKKIMLKMPRDLGESYQTSWISRETAKTLEKDGLLPSKP